MRPSSSPSDARGLFDGVLARGHVQAATDDVAWLQAMLDAEAALARAGARAGLYPLEAAEAIAAACSAERFQVADLGAAAAQSGNPVVPLVRALEAAVPDAAAGYVHLGATSQDILDSAAMLVARRALSGVVEDLRVAGDVAAGLAEAHRHTILAARTLLQQAVPTTFGLKAAGWMTALDRSAERLDRLARRDLAAQLGGAGGTLAALGPAGTDVLHHFADALGLAEPVLPWHTDRSRITELAGALGSACSAIGKIARDIVLLAQTEVGEVDERGPASRGGSSTLPHKRNPVAAVAATACAAQAPGLVATLLAAAGDHEHERAAGAWHAEWRPFTDLLRASGSAAAWLRDCLERLEVDPARMRDNLDHTGDLLMAERVTVALAPALGRLVAHDLVTRASAEAVARRSTLAQALHAVPDVAAHLDTDAIAALLEPAGYLGSADAMVDRALAEHRSLLLDHFDVT